LIFTLDRGTHILFKKEANKWDDSCAVGGGGIHGLRFYRNLKPEIIFFNLSI